jgi:hypothetical protein
MKKVLYIAIAAVAAFSVIGCGGAATGTVIPTNPFVGERFDGDIMLPTRGGGPSIQLEGMKISDTGRKDGQDNAIAVISGIAKETQPDGTVVTGSLSGTITSSGSLGLKVDLGRQINWTYVGMVRWTDGRGGPARWVEGQVLAVALIEQGAHSSAGGGDPAPTARIMWWAN